MKYQYLFFDWDGCLINSMGIWLEAYQKLFADYALSPTVAEISQKVFGDWNGPLKVGIKSKDLAAYTSKLVKLVNKNLKKAELFVGAEDLLKALQLNGRIAALLTTAKLSNLDPIIRKYNFKKYFQLILTAEDVHKHKPDPEMIDLALAKLKAAKDKSVMIGDSKSDLGAAQKAGIDSILFYPQQHEKVYNLADLQLYQPKHIVRSLKELKNLLF
ncbi:MAG: HAD family hydrolase [Candidatus Woesebacteria bacterium]|jgi:pyrophosphatase PpaX